MVNDRKEFGVLLLLGVLVAVFAFTLGVHLGKRVTPDGSIVQDQGDPTSLIPTVDDRVPGRQEILDQEKNVPEVVEDTLDETLKAETSESKLKLEQPVQTELPKETKAKDGGKTTVEEKAESVAPEMKEAISSLAAARRPSPPGRFTLQVGSYKTLDEAASQVKVLEAKGLSPFLRSVLLKNKGRWYRVYLGGYESMSSAEESGLSMKTSGTVDSFLVTNMVP